MTLCKDCKHLYDWAGMKCCGVLIGTPQPVDGHPLEENELFPAVMMRQTLCGWEDPKLFEPKTGGQTALTLEELRALTTGTTDFLRGYGSLPPK